MKVLFVSGEFPPMQGGVGDYTRELALALAEQGCTVQVVTSAAAGHVEGLAVYPVVESWGWGSWRQLLEAIRREAPDVVHVQYQAAAYAMHPAINFFPRRLRLLGAGRPRLAVTFHDLKVPYLFPKAGPLRRRVVEALARDSDAAITTNREDHERLSVALARSGIVRSFRRILPHINTISGVFLIVAGLFVAYYAWVELQELGSGRSSRVVTWSRDVQSALQRWVEDVGGGRLALAAGIVIAAALAITWIMRSGSTPSGSGDSTPTEPADPDTARS